MVLILDKGAFFKMVRTRSHLANLTVCRNLDVVDLINWMNKHHHEEITDLNNTVASHEMAYRMQARFRVNDFSDERVHTSLYAKPDRPLPTTACSLGA